MRDNLPELSFFESFFIWFNKEKREGYYATPLYLYKANTKVDFENKGVTVYLDKNYKTPKEEEGLLFPGNAFFPYVEKFGLLLVRFLNANLETYQSAYETFFFAYGFEILKEIDEDYTFKLKGKYENEKVYLEEMEKIYHDLQYKIQEIQREMITCINYVFNIENKEDLKGYTPSHRFAVYLIKHKGQVFTYMKNDNIKRDSYASRYLELSHKDDKELLEDLKNNPTLISMIDTHESKDLASVCYAVLEELVKTENNSIKKCQNCGMYFIPNVRLDEIYCDYPKENDKTCREKGAFQAYNERLKQNKALSEYRRIYQVKSNAISRNKDNKQMKKEFDEWKKISKDKVNKLKQEQLTEDEVYEWLIENK